MKDEDLDKLPISRINCPYCHRGFNFCSDVAQAWVIRNQGILEKCQANIKKLEKAIEVKLSEGDGGD